MCVVFDKPAGLLVIPAAKDRQHTLTDIANQQSVGSPGWRLHPCHRIDRETTGAIIYAKGKKAQKIMMELFRKRAIVKTYIAFVHGKLKKVNGEFRNPIRDLYRKKFTRPAPAVTAYKVIQVKKNFSVVEVQPLTGRTNQIRIHFSEAGHPLVGDRKFAFARDYALKFRRAALHAASLAWTHPVSRQKIHVRCDLPQDMTDFLKAH